MQDIMYLIGVMISLAVLFFYLRYCQKNKIESIYDKKTKNPKFKKLLEEGYKEMAKKEEKIVSYSSVDEMLDDLHTRKDWTIFDYIQHYWYIYFWNYVSDVPLRVKTFIQRGQRGWADSDTWCFDYYLSKVIAEGVKHLLKYGNSCWTKKDANALKEIIQTFKTAEQITSHYLIYTSSKKFTWSAYKKQKRTCKYMNKKFKRGKYRPMTLREVIRFEKGFEILKDKFFYLWD